MLCNTPYYHMVICVIPQIMTCESVQNPSLKHDYLCITADYYMIICAIPQYYMILCVIAQIITWLSVHNPRSLHNYLSIDLDYYTIICGIPHVTTRLSG